MHAFHRLLVAAPLLFVLGMAHAEVKQATGDGFFFVFVQRVKATPGPVYSALSHVDRWWSSDHTYSGDAANLSLEAEAGACFCERWKEGSVEHGNVILALRDQLLVSAPRWGRCRGRR